MIQCSPITIDPDLRRKERRAMAQEICLYRGENPNTVDRGGCEGWEKYEPLAGACIREAERLFALRDGAATTGSEIELAEKINLHLQLGKADPGFHLGEDDLCMIVKALLRDGAASECSLCRGAGFVTYRDGIAYETHDVEREEHLIEDCPECRPPAQAVTDRCVKCGCETKGEMAFVDGGIWCHPCADAVQPKLDPTAKGPDDCAEYMLLQARRKGQEQWTNIYAAQIDQFIGYGCEVRALTLPSTQSEATK